MVHNIPNPAPVKRAPTRHAYAINPTAITGHHEMKPSFTWTAGPMRHVIAALGGAPVTLVTNRHTGETMTGVTLLGFAPKGDPGGERLHIERVAQDGAVFAEWLPLGFIGPDIVPVVEGDYRQDYRGRAAGLYSAEHDAVRAVARRAMMAEFGDGGGLWGQWEFMCEGDRWVAMFTAADGGYPASWACTVKITPEGPELMPRRG